MVERKEALAKNSVMFILFDGKNIQIEERIEKNDNYFGYFLIPGGKVESGEGPRTALVREIREEYAFTHVKGEELGLIIVKEGEIESCKHVYLINYWNNDCNYAPEKRNIHTAVTLEEARQSCKHPVTQIALDLFEAYLFRQNSQGV